jgi:hypothetical protein
MEPRCPKEEDPGSQGQAAKLTDYRGNPNERLRACVHTAAMEVPKSSIFLHWPHQGGGATGKPCPDLRRRGPVTPGRRRSANGRAYLRVSARRREAWGAEAEQRAKGQRGEEGSTAPALLLVPNTTGTARSRTSSPVFACAAVLRAAAT